VRDALFWFEQLAHQIVFSVVYSHLTMRRMWCTIWKNSLKRTKMVLLSCSIYRKSILVGIPAYETILFHFFCLYRSKSSCLCYPCKILISPNHIRSSISLCCIVSLIVVCLLGVSAFNSWADEWQNFLERIGLIENIVFREIENRKSENHEKVKLELRLWASYRGQTLARTGMTHLAFEMN